MESSAGFMEVPLENNSQNVWDGRWMGQNIASKLMFCVFLPLRVLAYEKLKLCKIGFCFLFLHCTLKFFDTYWFLCVCKDTFIFQGQDLLFAVDPYRNKQSRVCLLGLNK